MKFILSMIICTSVYNTCLPPHQMDEVYNTHYECMIAGYEESIAKAKEIGSKEVNKYGTVSQHMSLILSLKYHKDQNNLLQFFLPKIFLPSSAWSLALDDTFRRLIL